MRMHFLTRLFYRMVAIFFWSLALVCLTITVAVGATLLLGHGEFVPMGLAAAVVAGFLWDSADRAWRTARFNPIYD